MSAGIFALKVASLKTFWAFEKVRPCCLGQGVLPGDFLDNKIYSDATSITLSLLVCIQNMHFNP